MNKCMASKDGVCQNIHAYGLKCGGYSTECRIKKAYDNLERVAKNVAQVSRKYYGLVSDQEGGVADD